MSKKRITTCCLVVDASIARAAGSPESKHPTGVLCRNFLLSIRSVCHRIAWIETIKIEWDKHDSLFARQWRVSMLNLNKLRPVDCAEVSGIRKSIREHCDDADILAIVLKDCHLVEAALGTDRRIASLDERVRGHLRELAAAVDALRPIVWVNLANPKEGAVEWLGKGSPREKKRWLRVK
jgi:hypothetical protein